MLNIKNILAISIISIKNEVIIMIKRKFRHIGMIYLGKEFHHYQKNTKQTLTFADEQTQKCAMFKLVNELFTSRERKLTVLFQKRR